MYVFKGKQGDSANTVSVCRIAWFSWKHTFGVTPGIATREQIMYLHNHKLYKKTRIYASCQSWTPHKSFAEYDERKSHTHSHKKNIKSQSSNITVLPEWQNMTTKYNVDTLGLFVYIVCIHYPCWRCSDSGEPYHAVAQLLAPRFDVDFEPCKLSQYVWRYADDTIRAHVFVSLVGHSRKSSWTPGRWWFTRIFTRVHAAVESYMGARVMMVHKYFSQGSMRPSNHTN